MALLGRRQPFRPKLSGVLGFTDVTFDAANNSGLQSLVSSWSGSASWNGNSRMLSVDVELISANQTVTAMTYGGANCTLIGAQSIAGGTGRVECWRICQNDSGAPAAGSNTLSVTLSGSLSFAVTWVSRYNVSQTGPTESFNSNSGINIGAANATATITPAADRTVVHAACATNDQNASPNQTSRNDVSAAVGSGIDEDSGPVVISPPSAQTMTVATGATKAWAIAGYAVRPLSAGSVFDPAFLPFPPPLPIWRDQVVMIAY